MGDPHVEIVDHHGEHISRRAVRAKENHVVEVLVHEPYVALHDIVHDSLAFLGRFQADHERRPAWSFRGVAIPPPPVVPHGLALGALPGADFLKLGGSGVTAVGLAGREQLISDFAVPRRARKLVHRLAVPVQPQPRHAVQNGGDGLRRGALAVGVFDAQQELSAGLLGIEPVEQRRAGSSDVKIAGGRGRKPQDRSFVLRHDAVLRGRPAYQACK